MTTAVADTALGARTIRKMQWRILPFIFLLYVVAYLDRTNVGFAALTMNHELGMNAQQFGLVVGFFFIGYFLFEIPSNLLLHRIGARIWIARILITWGIIATLTGLVRNVHELYGARFLLGLAEAGYYPGVVLYLTYWFRQRERAMAVAVVLMGIPITSIVGGPLSGFILDHAHWLEVSSWRWLLILEGIPAVVCGVLAYFVLPNRPADAKFLEREEKDWILAELAREEEIKNRQEPISMTQTFSHVRVWHLAAIQLTALTGLYSLSFWMPQVVKALSSHYSNSAVGLLVVIPQLFGLLCMVLVSRSSDRRLERRYHAGLSALVGGVGWFLLSAAASPLVTMVALSLIAIGVYSFFGPFWALPSEFLCGYSAASGIAMINSIGNLGGFGGPYAIGYLKDRTGSMAWGLALVGISMSVSALLLFAFPKKSNLPTNSG